MSSETISVGSLVQTLEDDPQKQKYLGEVLGIFNDTVIVALPTPDTFGNKVELVSMTRLSLASPHEDVKL